MKIAVLGAFGLMGEAALHDLAADPRVSQVLAADVNLARSKQVLAKIPRRRKILPIQADLTDTAGSARQLKGAASLLNASWYEFNLKAMDLALALKAHYVDLGGLYHMTLKQLKLDREFRKQGLLAALGCGSTPGITNMMVAKMVPGFKTIETVGIYDASHDPSLTEDSFLPPFSIRTMLDEYEQPAPVLLGGRMKDVPAHSGAEELEFQAPIGRVKAGTVIHSETATLPGYLKAYRVKNLFFKIVYPESVKRQLGLLVGMGLSKERALLTRMAQAGAMAMSGKPGDFEVLRVKVTGAGPKTALEKTWDCQMRPTSLLSAGAMGVGFTGAIAAVMLARRRSLVPAGVGAPESILQADPFFKELAARKVFSFFETISHPLPM
jgi:saccharopine dehydrogenase (NAD+, L-lysine-forming)